MPCLRQLSENTNIGRWAGTGSLGDREIQLSKKYLPELWIGVDVEFHSRCLIDLLLHFLAPRLKTLFQRREQWQVDCDPGPFHLGQHVDERYFHALEESRKLVSVELRLEYPAHLQRHVGIFTCVVACCFDRALVERDC
jgi:hypothetical protein